jgi:DNA-binding transcriptional MerR regulator
LSKAPDAFRTIREVAEDLDVPQHVLRFWETRFRDIRPMKRGGGRRYYRPEDIHLLRGIRYLLYGEGYTIRGVQRILKEQGVKFVQSIWQPGATQPVQSPSEIDPDYTPDGTETLQESAKNEVEAGRGLLALLPSLLGDDQDAASASPGGARLEPLLSVPDPGGKAARPRAAHGVGARGFDAPGLTREDLRKLQGALHELGECRKLLAAALTASA